MKRSVLAAAALAACAVSGTVLTAPAASAATAGTTSSPVYTVMNTSEAPPDGVYFRNSPHTADTIRYSGLGVYRNERIQVACYAWGDAVGSYNNHIWYLASNLTRPTAGPYWNVGYLNTHYVNDGMTADHPAPGVPAC